MGAGLLQLAPVASLVAGIVAEILMGGELLGIDEDRDDDPVGELKGLMHQGNVAIMQRAHGRHQSRPHRLGAPAGDGPAQLLDGADYLHRLRPCSTLMNDHASFSSPIRRSKSIVRVTLA